MQSTALPIHFIVIGAGISGLSCAIALRRVGHKVTVLESRGGNDKISGGLKLAPNATKILYHWGYRQEVQAMSSKSQAVSLSLYETGEFLGDHLWNEEVLRETGGEYQCTHYNDFHEFMLRKAISLGASIRHNATVTYIDPSVPSVELASGKTIVGDVIVGADGLNGLCRPLVVDLEPHNDPLVVYYTTVPTRVIEQHPDLKPLHDLNMAHMHSWFGNGKAAIGWPCGAGDRGEGSYAVQFFGPGESQECWSDLPSQEVSHQLLAMIANVEPRLRKLAELGTPPRRIPASGRPDFEDWVQEDGKLVLIGDAAHSLPVLVHPAAMAIEDGAVLARLFLHLRSHDQIPSFLYAFEELRKPRIKSVRDAEFGNVSFMTLPPCDMTEFRNADIRAKQAAGRNVLDPMTDSNASDDDGERIEGQWAEIKEMFGYDAEDEADNWWIEWGLLRERAKGAPMDEGLRVSVSMVEAC